MMTFDPAQPVFWDEKDLAREITRIFDICHGCRLCDKLCPSFDVLFRRLDRLDDDLTAQGSKDSPIDHLTAADTRAVSDLCYQCKLCQPKCPYTPPHQYQLDFPRLVMREQAVHRKATGLTFSDRALSNPDRMGAIGSTLPGLVNWVNGNGALRAIMEKTAGVHRNKTLPRYHSETFEDWFVRWKRSRGTHPRPVAKVAVYASCLVNFNHPSIARALTLVLDHSDVEVVSCQKICCGMPSVSIGDMEEGVRRADENIATLARFVQEGYDIVIPSPSCSLNIRQEYPHLCHDRDMADLVANASYDAAEYLMKLHGSGKLKTDFVDAEGEEFLYHLPCHLKAQNIGYKSRDLLALIPGAKVRMSQRCSGHDGQWSMKKEYYEISLSVGEKLFQDIRKAPDATVVSDCAFAHLHIGEGTGRETEHPLETLCTAYGLSYE